MSNEKLPDYINSPADVAEHMTRLQGLVQILEYIGGAESVIDKNALAHTFWVINDHIQEIRDMLYALDVKMQETTKKGADKA